MPTDGVRVRVSDGRRTAVLREARKPGVARDEFVKAPYTHEGEAPRSEFHLRGVVSTGVPLQELASPSHQVTVRSTRPGARGDGARRLRSGCRAIATSSFATGWLARRSPRDCCCIRATDENFFLLMAEPPQVVAADEMPPREYIFVLDVSGSMHGFPLDTAKKLMGDLVNVLALRHVQHRRVCRRLRHVLAGVGAGDARQSHARAAVHRRKNGGGGTRLLAALQRAVALPRQSACRAASCW